MPAPTSRLCARATTWAWLTLGWLALGCGGARPEPTAHAATADDGAPSAALMPESELPDPDGAWLDGDTSRADALFERYPRDPRVVYLRARQQREAGDAETAIATLRAALASSDRLPAAAALPWRIRAELAIVLGATGQDEEAIATAGLMCEHPDEGMVPPYLTPLIARVTDAGVCAGGSLCARAMRCCQALLSATNAVAPGAVNEETMCGSIETVRGTPNEDQTCTMMIDGYRQALEAMNADASLCPPVTRAAPPGHPLPTAPL